MTTLQYVHLDVEQDKHREPPFSQKVEVGGRDEVAEGLLILANLPLRGVTVTLRDEYWKYHNREAWAKADETFDEDFDNQFDEEAGEVYGRWTMVQRQRWATAVRDGLLGRRPQTQDGQEVANFETSRKGLRAA